MPKKLYETDLYNPIKKFFLQNGYKVNGEVKGCDMTAHKNDELIIIELKKNFNMKLLYQAIDRQKITSLVYIAIPRPVKKETKNFNKIKHIVQSLKLGLITVALDSPTKKVDIIIQPEVNIMKKSKKQSKILKEIEGRSMDINKGGSNKVKIATAFRERCIHIACALEEEELLSPAKLIKNYGCGDDTGSILRNNYYGWFSKESRGIYKLSTKGKEEINNKEFKQLLDFYKEIIKKTNKKDL